MGDVTAVRALTLALSIAMALMGVVPRAPHVQAAGSCGGAQGFNFGGGFQGGFQGFQAGFQGGFQAFNNGGFNFNGGGFQGGLQNFGAGGLNFNGGVQNFGAQFGGQPGCNTGVFGLIPDNATVNPGSQITYRLVWVVPTNWHDLEYLDLRIRDGGQVVVVRWFEGTNVFAVVDPNSGQVLDSGAGGAQKVLHTALVDVLLQSTFKEDSGPTGQAVGINVQLQVSSNLEGHTLSVDVAAKQDTAAAEPYELAALLRVVGGPAPLADADRDDRERKLTDEQRQQRERTNTSNLDEYRTEGSAVESDCGATVPTVTIANRDGNVVLQLLHDAKDACRLVQPGDYVEAIGEKQNELLYEADQLTVRRNGTRVR